jgi:nonribosomal peptide synthetase protein VioG
MTTVDAAVSPPAWQAWRAYNGGPVAYPDDGGLISWIGRVAREHPTRPAVSAVDRCLTYAELEAESSAVATRLLLSGVSQGAIVAVASSRNASAYVAVLAVLKAGCGYVPVDPMDPPDRLEFILSDAAAQAIVATSAQMAVLDEVATDIQVRCRVDDPAVDTPATLAPSPVRSPDSDHDRTCYVMYTSGTAGRPKGVRISGLNVLSCVRWVVSQHQISSHHRLAQTSSLTFDPSVQQIFSAWVTGACVVPVPDHELIDPRACARWLRRERISHLDIVTSHWHHLREAIAQDPALGVLPDLRWIIIGGETLHYEQAYEWYQNVSSPALLDNCYGPTETTVNATWVVVDPTITHGQVPIGKPLPNYRLYVVDERGALCGPGVEGELLIAGDGIAQRYQSAEATARAFQRFTLPDGKTERVYRTGDIARLRDDGHGGWTLEFRGRVDTQIKIRGYRIELEEVEATAKVCPGVRDAAVLVRGNPPEQLICLYVAGDQVPPSVLRGFQMRRLAAHQIPSMYLRLDEFPLTRNGKLDREALARELPAALARRPHEGRPPRGRLEGAIAQVWCDVLGIGQIGADENFFTIGGSSLLTMTIVGRLRAVDIQAEVEDLFGSPTVAGVAAAVQVRSGTAVPTAAADPRSTELGDDGPSLA